MVDARKMREGVGGGGPHACWLASVAGFGRSLKQLRERFVFSANGTQQNHRRKGCTQMLCAPRAVAWAKPPDSRDAPKRGPGRSATRCATVPQGSALADRTGGVAGPGAAWERCRGVGARRYGPRRHKASRPRAWRSAWPQAPPCRAARPNDGWAGAQHNRRGVQAWLPGALCCAPICPRPLWGAERPTCSGKREQRGGRTA